MPIEQMLIEAAEAMRESGEPAFRQYVPNELKVPVVCGDWTIEEILAREG
jgi:hypothetical protein